MRLFRMLRMRLRSFFGRHKTDAELDAEIQFHLEQQIEENLAREIGADEARYAALRTIGAVARLKEECREMRGISWLENLGSDLRYALRGLRKTPAFSAAVIFSLALGIGANTAVFSLVDALMLRMLPVQKPQQLVELLSKYPGEPRGSYFSQASYEYYRDHNHVFSGLLGAHSTTFSVRQADGETETVNGEAIVGDFFPVLELKPAIGRRIDPEGDRDGSPSSAVAVLSWLYWQDRFNLDPAVVGKTIFVDGAPLTIIGVTPREFRGLHPGVRTDLWIPLSADSMIHGHSRVSLGGLYLMGRLKPGVSIEQARAEMSILFRFTIEERFASSKNPLIRQLKFEMEPAGTGLSLLRDHFAKPLLILMALVALLLLIACVNIASMMLARAASRQHETAVRISLGAGRIRLTQLALVEALTLSAVGAAAGLLLAWWGAGALVRILQSGRQIVGVPGRIDIQIAPDLHVLLFTAGIALLTGVLFGLTPAWNASVCTPSGALRQTGETKSRRLFGKILLAAQIACSLVLLSAAGLLIHHLSNLENFDLGFRRDHVLLVSIDSAHSGYAREQLIAAEQQLLPRLESIPGVLSATACEPTPLSGGGASGFATAEGYQERPEDRRYIAIAWTAPKYFKTLGVSLLAGRDFDLHDEGGPAVAILNQAMARYYFAGRNPIGKHVTLDHATGASQARTYEIVGVVGDANYYEIREPALRAIYLDAFQWLAPRNFALRTSVDPVSVAPEIRTLIKASLKTVAISQIITLTDQINASIVPERLIAKLSGLFGSVASLLVAVGIYGLLAYTVARRISEIGIRMALGASRGHVIRMILAEASVILLAGIGAGAPIAFWTAKLVASAIGEPSNTIPPNAFSALAMIAVGAAAAFFPARRASRVDPMIALHHE
ncbi:MAG TPA: ABC transporter permease [Bryobacteraceae bacterium]|nr:ABC transporter permease [Bryobacteraceae bacterium]